MTKTTAGAATPKTRAGKPARRTKIHKCLARLQRSKGASIAELQELTGWQAHSVCAALSGLRRKRHRPGQAHPPLSELRLLAIKHMWPRFAERADKEGWPAACFLGAMAEHELAEHDRRRIERHLAEARLLPGKSLDTFHFEAVPMISKARIMAQLSGLEKWRRILSRALIKYLHGRVIRPPPGYLPA